MGVRPTMQAPGLSPRGRLLVIGLGVFVAIAVIAPQLIGLYTNWLWFGEVDYRGVFSTTLLSRLVLFVVVALIVGGAVFLAQLAAYRARPIFVPVAGPNDPIARYRSLVLTKLRTLGVALPIGLGFFSGLIAQGSWQVVQLFWHGGEFGTKDPQFGLDVGFYAFDLPFYQFVLRWLFVSVVLAFLANALGHYVFGGLRLGSREGVLTRSARIQLAVLAGIFVLLKAVAYWFDRYALLASGRKEPIFTGASYTDINAVLPAKLILLTIAVICAVAFFAGIFVRDLRIPALAMALLVLSSIMVGSIWPFAMERLTVAPNAAIQEAEYIRRNIEATREAYGITPEKVKTVNIKGSSDSAALQFSNADRTTLTNARLLDPNVLSRTFDQQESKENFFGFDPELDIDRYHVDGRLQDFVVAARELKPSDLSGNQQDWINQHTVYTHGKGIVAAPANRVRSTGELSQSGKRDAGFPDYSDLPLFSKLKQDRIYFGELIASTDKDYALVGGTGDAVEYDGEDDKFRYDGAGGVSIGNWFNRLAFFAKYAEWKILFSGAIGDDSKIIFNRDPGSRVKAVAPWLTTDGDAYPAVVGGRVVWIVDGYTTIDSYPYAQRSSLDGLVTDSIDRTTGRIVPAKKVSYIRNSVKATVDAYDGTVSLYEFDDKDPVLKAWRATFPGVVKAKSEINEELRQHFRYPEDLFKVQREMLAKYQVSEPVVFFNGNAFWDVPADPRLEGNDGAKQPPYYVLIGDENGQPSFQLTSAMQSFRREFLASFISVKSDPDGYGEITVRRLPANSVTPGPRLTQNTMTSSPAVVNERTTLAGAGSNTIIYGNLLTLPIGGDSMLYIEPLYTERKTSGTTSFPQLSRVLVSLSGSPRIGYDDTLPKALAQIFPQEQVDEIFSAIGGGQDVVEVPAGTAPPAPAAGPPPSGDLGGAVVELSAAMENLRSAQSSGDMGQLGVALERLDRAIKAYEALPK